jgi:hypothetical protein
MAPAVKAARLLKRLRPEPWLQMYLDLYPLLYLDTWTAQAIHAMLIMKVRERRSRWLPPSALSVPDEGTWETLIARIQTAGMDAQDRRDYGYGVGMRVADPAQNGVELFVEKQ